MPSFRTNDDVALHYYDEGQGRPVVLVPGYGAAADDWALQWATLRAAGYRVISLDRRWHGQSERPAYGQRMSRHGMDLHDLLQALDLTDTTLIGQSMGAGTIWAYMSLFGAERLAGVVSVDQTPRMANSPDWEFGMYGMTDDNVGTLLNEPGRVMTGHGRAWSDPAAIDALIKQAGGRGLSSDIAPETIPLRLDQAHQDWRDVVARLHVPALIIAGADSQLWPSEHAAATAALSPFASSAVVPGAGHWAHHDQPEAVNTLLVDFTDALQTAR
ncbi:alpha/beta hydrolase [Streptomyces sp. NA04227]|uniref:alpha/beta fold hydrolase n=1 Tax=Streptomyces sp. NA04227 TaxID=2742136 RepID=UPI001590AFA6|nr:alpha/beta hydrolase [Streptomyces sp. NA04227]QKW09954.1 alpha/beta hydrolase [Streptomyces sp. NA04227]